MSYRFAAVVVLGLAVVAGPVVAAESAADQAAVTGAEQWLALVDAGKYAESWKEAGETFRNAVTQEQWADAARAVREPLGRLGSRKLQRAVDRTSLPGAPDGEYVVILFDASFANKKAAVEQVVQMKQQDGRWGVVGYFIR